MNEYRVRRAQPIAAEIRAPGDCALSLRALLIAALANGPSVITGFLPAAVCLDLIQACRALGVKSDYLSDHDSELPWQPEPGGAAGPTRLRIMGTGGKLRVPSTAVDCGQSVIVPLLLAGVLAGQPVVTRLSCADPAAGAVLAALAAAFQEMGASIKASPRQPSTVITVEGRAGLHGRTFRPPVASPAARDALLLAALGARGRSTFTDAVPGPDHLERLLHHFQVKTARRGPDISTWGGQTPESRDLHLPGDIAYAAPFIVTAAATPGSMLTVRGVGLNPARAGWLRVLIRMGAQVVEEVHPPRGGEPFGTLIIRGAPLAGTTIGTAEVAAFADEIPLLAVAAALARGSTVIEHTPAIAARLAHMVTNLELMGVKITQMQSGVAITGAAGRPLQHGVIPSHGDPGLAMACAVAGFFAEGETIVENVACVESRWHGFGATLARFQSREISAGLPVPMLHTVLQRAQPDSPGRKVRKPAPDSPPGSR